MSTSRKMVRKKHTIYPTTEELRLLRMVSSRDSLSTSRYLLDLMHEDLKARKLDDTGQDEILSRIDSILKETP